MHNLLNKIKWSFYGGNVSALNGLAYRASYKVSYTEEKIQIWSPSDFVSLPT